MVDKLPVVTATGVVAIFCVHVNIALVAVTGTVVGAVIVVEMNIASVMTALVDLMIPVFELSNDKVLFDEMFFPDSIVFVTKVINCLLVVVLECANTTSDVAITLCVLLFRLRLSLVSVDSVRTIELFI